MVQNRFYIVSETESATISNQTKLYQKKTMYLRCIIILSTYLSVVFATHIQLIIPSVSITNTASKLPPSTHATLTTLSKIYSAPLREKGDFDFPNITTGSYLLEIYCHTFFFAPLRVDIQETEGNENGPQDKVEVWGTFRGNEWDNKGEDIVVNTKNEGKEKIFTFEIQILAAKKYLTERSHCTSFLYQELFIKYGQSITFAKN